MKILLLFCLFAFADEAPLRIQLPAEPNSLDPYQVGDVIGFNIISNVAEGLVRIDGKGNLRNALAESYSISSDGLKYRFKLRKGIRWSDGKEIRAEDFLFGLRYALDPKTAARDAHYLFGIKGAKAFREGKGEPRIQAEGNKLEIELEHPDTAFLQALTMPMAAPLRKESLGPKGWLEFGPVSGPYRISAHKLEREILLEPNPYYEGKRQAVLFKMVPEETTALNLFETKQLDILQTISPTEVGRLQKTGLLANFPSAVTFFLSFNVKKPPFNELRWRKAVSAALDRESLAKLFPSFQATTSFLPAAVEGNVQLNTAFPKELAEVKELPKAELVTNFASSAVNSAVMQRVQENLRVKLGMSLKLEQMEWKSYIAKLQLDPPPLFPMGWSATFDDPLPHLRLFLSGDRENRTGYNNPDYDKIVERIRALKRGPKRKELVQEAQRILVAKDVVVVPFVERRQLFAVGKGVSGFSVSPYGVMDLREIGK